MKIRKNEANRIREAMTLHFKTVPPEVWEFYKERVKKDARVKDIDKRMRWDLFYGSGLPRDSEFMNSLRKQGIEDNHIDTVLRQVQKEIRFYI